MFSEGLQILSDSGWSDAHVEHLKYIKKKWEESDELHNEERLQRDGVERPQVRCARFSN